jgi:hypothetical protein
MFRPKKYCEAERRLANLARKIAMKRDVLYHGTRYAKSILRSGVLFSADRGGVCFTRSPEEAAYWALLERDNDEGRGAILIFDRQSLRCRYKVEPHHDPIWDTDTNCRDELEEAVWGDIINIGKHLVGFVSDPAVQSSARLRILNAKQRMDIEARLQQLVRQKPDWRCRPKKRVELSVAKEELACKALSDGLGVVKVANQLGLRISTVRRLAGMLQPQEYNRSLAHIVLGWNFGTLLKLFRRNGGHAKAISAMELARVLGGGRIDLLVAYCGIGRDDLLNTLAQQVSDLISELLQINVHRKAHKRSPAVTRKRRYAEQRPLAVHPLTCP